MSNRIQAKLAILDQAMVSGVNFLVSIFIAKGLGLDAFGRFSLIIMVVLFISSLNLAAIIQPLLAKVNKSYKDEIYFDNMIVIEAMFCFMSSVLVCLFVQISNQIGYLSELNDITLWLSLLVFFSTFQDGIRRILFAYLKPFSAFGCDAVNYLPRLVILFYFMWNECLTIESVFIVYLLTSLVASIVGCLMYNGLRKPNASFVKPIFISHWVFSRWLIGSSVTQWFTGNSFVLASAVVMGPAIVGLIRVAQNLMGVTHVIFLAMENYAPQAALRQLRSDGILGLKKYISKLALINLQIVMFFICLLWIFPDAIIQFLYGEEYLKHLDFLLVYLFVYFAIALNATLKIYHRTIINTKAIFTADMISAVYSILLAYPLVSFFLDDGVIYGTITASTIVTLVLLFKIKVGREL